MSSSKLFIQRLEKLFAITVLKQCRDINFAQLTHSIGVLLKMKPQLRLVAIWTEKEIRDNLPLCLDV